MAITAVASASDAVSREYRDFTGTNGKVIQAALLDKTADTAVLLLRNGSRTNVPLDKLSEEDRDYVKSWSREKAIFLQKCRGLTIRQCLELRGYESFPFRFENNSIFIDAQVNGKPARVLIDTGAGISLLHTGYAADTGLEVGPMTETIHGVGGEAPAGWTPVPTIQLGEAVFENRRILATDLLKDKPEGTKSRMDVILGADFMNQLDAVISYPERRVFLRPDRSDRNEAGDTLDFRIFKTKDGQTLRGKVVSKTPTVATLALVNGRTLQKSIDFFVDEDAAYLKSWSEAGALFLQHCQSLTINELLQLRNYHSFQFTRRGNHLFVDGALNDKDVTYMIDTGADGTLLHINAAKDAKCEVGPMDQSVWGIGGQRPAAVADIKKLTMGDVILTNRKVLASDMMRGDNDDQYEYVGLFGADFLRELDAVITYTENRIFLIQR
ncbi:MAG: aspartyl protease family protein [Luteolibacter sp.]